MSQRTSILAAQAGNAEDAANRLTDLITQAEEQGWRVDGDVQLSTHMLNRGYSYDETRVVMVVKVITGL